MEHEITFEYSDDLFRRVARRVWLRYSRGFLILIALGWLACLVLYLVSGNDRLRLSLIGMLAVFTLLMLGSYRSYRNAGSDPGFYADSTIIQTYTDDVVRTARGRTESIWEWTHARRLDRDPEAWVIEFVGHRILIVPTEQLSPTLRQFIEAKLAAAEGEQDVLQTPERRFL